MTTSSTSVGRTAHPTVLVESDLVTHAGARRVLAASRIAVGFIFLWAFLDKTFGLHYSTGAAVAKGSPSLSWLNGGSPSQGFLLHGTSGPFATFFANIASPATDWLFMLCMLGVGVAVMLGIGLRASAVAGSLVLILMWAAEWPFVQGTTNPVIDYHIVYGLTLVICALTLAGDTWGLGRRWGQLELVRKNPWLR
ncbi:MAG: DoxX family protein [Cellulomonas sp.]